ncbi:MAG: FAD-dependent oxidoreductase [Pseudomonadota bacterium]|nr:FAD-dependent oxidoreductase [Pseudomonadota bacterium]
MKTPEYAMPFDKHVAVMGAGMGGVMTALILADAGWQVTLLESADSILSKSSAQTPGRIGLGFHYADPRTAEMLLRTSIDFIRQFPNFLIAQDRSQGDPLRHGRYYITNDSVFSVEQIMSTYERLKVTYTTMVKEDPQNAVFGHPDLFYRILYEEEYSKVVNSKRVVKGIETCEHLLDWSKFRTFLCQKIETHPNIRLITKAFITKLARTEQAKFVLTYSADAINTARPFNDVITPYVVNCTWQNSESLDVQLGLKLPEDIDRTNRVKAIATVKLPESLSNMHHAFFLVGEHCMVSNMGGGEAKMTFAPVTNVISCAGLKIPPAWGRLVDHHYFHSDIDELMPGIGEYLAKKPSSRSSLSNELKQYISTIPRANWDMQLLLKLYFGEQIKMGVAQDYIPEMQNAEVLAVNFGVVKTQGDVDQKNKNSRVHIRDYYGVEELQCGYLTNDAMKFVYSLENARIVLERLNAHYQKDKQIMHVASQCSKSKQEFWVARNSARQTTFNLGEQGSQRKWGLKLFDSDSSTVGSPVSSPTRIAPVLSPARASEPSTMIRGAMPKNLCHNRDSDNSDQGLTQPESDFVKHDDGSTKRLIDEADFNLTPVKKR